MEDHGSKAIPFTPPIVPHTMRTNNQTQPQPAKESCRNVFPEVSLTTTVPASASGSFIQNRIWPGYCSNQLICFYNQGLSWRNYKSHSSKEPQEHSFGLRHNLASSRWHLGGCHSPPTVRLTVKPHCLSSCYKLLFCGACGDMHTCMCGCMPM